MTKNLKIKKSILTTEKSYIKGLFPGFMIIPYIAVWICDFLSFYIPKLVNFLRDATFYTIEIKSIDSLFHVVPAWMIVYFGCYITWYVFSWLLMKQNKKLCYDYATAIIISEIVCLTIFIIYPTNIARDTTSYQGQFLDFAIDFLYKIDTPVNLFPSMHCLISYILWRFMIKCDTISLGTKIFAFVVAILVFFAVLYTKQHYFADIIGAIVVTEISMFISKNLHLGDKIRKKIFGE